jgi:hypothetical protein
VRHRAEIKIDARVMAMTHLKQTQFKDVADWQLLLSAAHSIPAVDSAPSFFVICDYTGKEVVG